MYADDTTLTCVSDTVEQVLVSLQAALKKVEDWSLRNRMKIHPEKTEAFLIKRKAFGNPSTMLTLNGRPIKWVKSTRILGLTIDDSLKWKNHIDELELTFTRKLNLLKSLRFLPQRMQKDFYWKVVFPAVNYGWGSYNTTQIEILERMHIRTARIIHGIAWDVPSEEVVMKTNWKTLQSTYKSRLLQLAHKIYYRNAPEQLCSLVQVRTTNTRQRDIFYLEPPRTDTNYMSKSISYKLATAWNSLPFDIEQDSNYNSFKKKLSKYDLNTIDFIPYITNKKPEYVYYK